MKLRRLFVYFLLFIFHFSLVTAQNHPDHLVPLKTNPALTDYVKKAKKVHGFVWRLISDSIVLHLPFLDDFSHGGPYPNDSLWMDHAAFINNTYPICPPTIGVATLDGANSAGQPYNPSCPPGASYPADSLTSRPINLLYNVSAPHTGLTQADSLWLSFYWQAGGRGMAPLTADTLLLQFRTSHTPWTTIWYQLGYSPVAPDTGFHLVMLKILDTMHLPLNPSSRFNPFDSIFQFRFKNYACTSANDDQWNIDEVYLKDHRQSDDTNNGLHANPDISFVYEAPSLLANYQYMPWEQFTANDLRDTMYLPIRNNGFGLIPISDQTYNSIGSGMAFGGNDNVEQFNLFGYDTNYLQTHFPVKSKFIYTPLIGPDTIIQTTYLTHPGDFIPWNDTLRFKQIFSDYYAYDDGTAETSYFINGPTPIELGEEFTLNKSDTLRGLELYFNYMYVNPANYDMRMAVWDNSGPSGSPGNLIYEDTVIESPRTSDTLNGFTIYPYHSPTPLVFGAGQSIYVGWVQTYGDSLNIGFDMNTNSQSKICYNVNTWPGYWSTGWYPGDYAGSLMMRPIFGHDNFHSPITTHSDNGEKAPLAPAITIYPNPASDMVNLSSAMPANSSIRIYTADGREYLNNGNFYGNSINTSSLPAGFYIVALTPEGGQTSYQKLLIQR